MTWEQLLETASLEELYEAAAEQLREGHPVPLDVYVKLEDAGYII